MPDAPVKRPAPARLCLFNRELEWDGVSRYWIRLAVLNIVVDTEHKTWRVLSDLSDKVPSFEYEDLARIEHPIEQHVLKLSRALR